MFELEIELEHLKSEGSSQRSGASSLQLNLPDQEKLPLGKTVSGGNEIQEENVSEVPDTLASSKPKRSLYIYKYLRKDIQGILPPKMKTNNINVDSPDNKQNLNSHSTDISDESETRARECHCSSISPASSTPQIGTPNRSIETIPIAESDLGESKIRGFASSPIVILLVFALLIIFVVWVTFIRPIWENRKKNENWKYTW